MCPDYYVSVSCSLCVAWKKTDDVGPADAFGCLESVVVAAFAFQQSGSLEFSGKLETIFETAKRNTDY